MRRNLLFVSVVALTFFVTLTARGEKIWSSNAELDTANIALGQVVLLRPTDSISYSTKWAEGYDRKIDLIATPENGSAYHIYSSSGEEEGKYVWNYLPISPSLLPRDADYTLSYTVSDSESGYVFAFQNALPTVTILPEPSTIIHLLLLGSARFFLRLTGY